MGIYAHLYTSLLGPLRCFVGVRELNESDVLCVQTLSRCSQCHCHVQCHVRADGQSFYLDDRLIHVQVQVVIKGIPTGAGQWEGGRELTYRSDAVHVTSCHTWCMHGGSGSWDMCMNPC